MRITCLQHVAFEGPAYIGTWAESRRLPLIVCKVFAGEILPALDSFDLLIVLGGPMSVIDEDRFDWLAPEKQFVSNAIQHCKQVLGICLGAQLIATVLGSKVYPNLEQEIGWFPVERTPESVSNHYFATLPQWFNAFHWHGETFDLPNNASCLARSQACAQQAFAIGNRVLGLQFHLESTAESVEALYRNCASDIGQGPYVQPVQSRVNSEANFSASNTLMASVLDGFCGTTL